MHSEKNLTILNIGNTHVHVFDSLPDGSIVRRIVLATPDFMKTTAIWIENPRQTIAASVVPAVTEILRSSGVFVVSPKMTFPFSVRKLDLSTVGADRLANAAQLTDGKLPAVCIDFGTAVTFEVVTEDREFAGGAIMPGRMLLRRSLNDYTAQLPLIGITDLIPAGAGKQYGGCHADRNGPCRSGCGEGNSCFPGEAFPGQEPFAGSPAEETAISLWNIWLWKTGKTILHYAGSGKSGSAITDARQSMRDQNGT